MTDPFTEVFDVFHDHEFVMVGVEPPHVAEVLFLGQDSLTDNNPL